MSEAFEAACEIREELTQLRGFLEKTSEALFDTLPDRRELAAMLVMATHCTSGVSREGLKFAASYAVEAADALLAELERKPA